MPTPHISQTWLEKVDNALREAAMEGSFQHDYLSTSLIELGFRKFRYFEYSLSTINDAAYYVLKHVSKDISLPPDELMLLPANELNLHEPNSQVKPRIFVGGNDSRGKLVLEFEEKIGVTGLSSIFLPIHAGHDLIASFCVSWSGNEDELISEDISALALLSRLCGRYIRLGADFHVADAKHKIYQIDFRAEEDGYTDAHSQFLTILDNECPSYVSSVLEYNWSNAAIEKIQERRREDVLPDEIQETYFRGRGLTGTALDRREPFLITKITEADTSGFPELSGKVLRQYERIIPAPLSILYATFESGHRDFIVRLCSKPGEPNSYFSSLDLTLLGRLCRMFRHRSNEFANQRNLSLINELFQKSIFDFSQYRKVIDKFAELYTRVFDFPLVLLARQQPSSTVNHIYCQDETYVRRAGEVTVERLEKLVTSISKEGVAVRSAEKFNHLIGMDLLSPGKNKMVFLMCLKDEDLEGVLLTEIRSQSSESQIAQNIKPKTAETLEIVRAIVASAISASARHITTENAKRLIGHIGHEIESPIAALSNTAQLGLEKVLSLTNQQSSIDRTLTDAIQNTVSTALDSIDSESRSISVLMDMAIDMAQETATRLDVTFRAFDLSELLERSADFVRKEITRYHPSGTRCTFKFNEASKRLHRFVGDEFLLEKIFVNLYRNAVKYSNPPGQRMPIEIDVIANPQPNLVDIQIINWGVPVKANDYERIFREFERGHAKDPVRARRGMGLGLYVARRYAEVHSGTVRCKSSEATFDDPQRRSTEGFTTVFEVRLSRELTVSTVEVEFR